MVWVLRLLRLRAAVCGKEPARPEIYTTVSMLDVAADRSTVDLYLAGHPVPLLLGAPSTAA